MLSIICFFGAFCGFGSLSLLLFTMSCRRGTRRGSRRAGAYNYGRGYGYYVASTLGIGPTTIKFCSMLYGITFCTYDITIRGLDGLLFQGIKVLFPGLFHGNGCLFVHTFAGDIGTYASTCYGNAARGSHCHGRCHGGF